MHHEISATLEVPLIHTECAYVTPWLSHLLCLDMDILNYMSNTRVIHVGFCCYLLLVTCSIPCWKRWEYLFCESIDYCEEISNASLDFKILWLGRVAGRPHLWISSNLWTHFWVILMVKVNRSSPFFLWSPVIWFPDPVRNL